jgi:AbrB family looped-hinge helix DNA binding protein
MSKSERGENMEDREEEGEVVAVTKNGQATIPKRFREKLGIEPPEKVVFRETESGEIVVEKVPSPKEMRGFAARKETTTDRRATEILREKREEDKRERDGNAEEE